MVRTGSGPFHSFPEWSGLIRAPACYTVLLLDVVPMYFLSSGCECTQYTVMDVAFMYLHPCGHDSGGPLSLSSWSRGTPDPRCLASPHLTSCYDPPVVVLAIIHSNPSILRIISPHLSPSIPIHLIHLWSSSGRASYYTLQSFHPQDHPSSSLTIHTNTSHPPMISNQRSCHLTEFI